MDEILSGGAAWALARGWGSRDDPKPPERRRYENPVAAKPVNNYDAIRLT